MAWFAFRPSNVSPRWILFKISLATVSKGFILPSALWMISVESSFAWFASIFLALSAAYVLLGANAAKHAIRAKLATFLTASSFIILASFLKRERGFTTLKNSPSPSKK